MTTVIQHQTATVFKSKYYIALNMDEYKDKNMRENIFALVKEYINSKLPEKFIPGKTWIRYAGRVFDTTDFPHV
ncbi:hypothetical protein OXIME_000781 [Oxyplasma meridianum]|uniref:Transposase n=1 Tax=Oxyplasma meridianum TaxID=3073602 RepID=A0AAX4NFJ0_9ARCH